MDFFDRLKVSFHRFTGDTSGQIEDLKKMTEEAAAAPRGSQQEAISFCTVQDQNQYITGGKGMNSQEFSDCYRSFRLFQSSHSLLGPLIFDPQNKTSEPSK